MTRIGVLSDTHITSPRESLPPQLLEEFASVDLILHAGDWVDPCVLEQLRPLAKVIGVRGNMDNPGIKCIMPELKELEIACYKIGLIHGWGSPAGIERRIRSRFQCPPDLIVFGHTHQPTIHEEEGVLYFNPGSPTDRAFCSQRSYGLIDLGEQIQARIIPLR